LRLLLDEQHDPMIAKFLRSEGHDVIAFSERPELPGTSDRDLLDVATAERRALLTENVRDFAVIHQERMSAEQPHHGIVLTDFRRFPRRKAIRRALLNAIRQLLRVYSTEDALRDQLVWLS
jgi:predicted nuclease of predicted toxin-antitoxin system